jgi:hypothetical protein
MEVVEVPVILDSTEWSHESHIRTPGLHLTDVIRSYMRNVKGVSKERDDLDQQDLEAYRTCGFLFEWAMYERVLAKRNIERLGEFELDGIVMTPDAVDMTEAVTIETKMTWRSMPTRKNGKDIEGDFEEWWMQIMAACKALNLRQAELWVMWANGGYGADRKPKLRMWRAEFEQADLDRNWRRIVNHAKWMREKGEMR